jgi:hypothetical protein
MPPCVVSPSKTVNEPFVIRRAALAEGSLPAALVPSFDQ